MTARTRQYESIPQAPFAWNPQLNQNERQRYEEIRAGKIRKEEPWRNPEEIRENFIRGYTENLNATKRD
jgi:hypothetical protein